MTDKLRPILNSALIDDELDNQELGAASAETGTASATVVEIFQGAIQNDKLRVVR